MLPVSGAEFFGRIACRDRLFLILDGFGGGGRENGRWVKEMDEGRRLSGEWGDVLSERERLVWIKNRLWDNRCGWFVLGEAGRT